jgi:hypothetical protein
MAYQSFKVIASILGLVLIGYFAAYQHHYMLDRSQWSCTALHEGKCIEYRRAAP